MLAAVEQILKCEPRRHCVLPRPRNRAVLCQINRLRRQTPSINPQPRPQSAEIKSAFIRVGQQFAIAIMHLDLEAVVPLRSAIISTEVIGELQVPDIPHNERRKNLLTIHQTSPLRNKSRFDTRPVNVVRSQKVVHLLNRPHPRRQDHDADRIAQVLRTDSVRKHRQSVASSG